MHTIDPALHEGLSPVELIGNLRACTERRAVSLMADEEFSILYSEDTPISEVRDILREVMLETYSYNEAIISATITCVGQLPRDVDPRILQGFLMHQHEEFYHGMLALNDYVALGGDRDYAVNRGMGPAAYAVAGVRNLFAKEKRPFAALGALYYVEYLTALVTEPIMETLKRRGITQFSSSFVSEHAVEDINHTRLLEMHIETLCVAYPGAAAEVVFGYNAYAQVFPTPVWREAFARVRSGEAAAC